MDEDNVFDLIHDLIDEETEVTIRAENDGLRVNLQLTRFPPIELSVRPANLEVGNELWSHEAQVPGELADGVTTLSEGQIETFQAFLGSFEVLDGPPGPDIVEMELER